VLDLYDNDTIDLHYYSIFHMELSPKKENSQSQFLKINIYLFTIKHLMTNTKFSIIITTSTYRTVITLQKTLILNKNKTTFQTCLYSLNQSSGCKRLDTCCFRSISNVSRLSLAKLAAVASPSSSLSSSSPLSLEVSE
jgi:hypothetical protein